MILNGKYIHSNKVPYRIKKQPFFFAEKTYTVEKDKKKGCRLYMHLTNENGTLTIDLSGDHQPLLEKFMEKKNEFC